MAKVQVLFVCLGNICRSPTAHGVFEHLLREQGMAELVYVDSCGTGDWHIGHAPDPRATSAAGARGYDLSQLKARQVAPQDFEQFDYILAMDKQNLTDLSVMCPASFKGRLDLFLHFLPAGNVLEVPDPYYGDTDGFGAVLELVEAASVALLEEIRAANPA